jgi:GH25 family lysozyme M1 (1,4-beta-N-acetylmuramidase)
LKLSSSDAYVSGVINLLSVTMLRSAAAGGVAAVLLLTAASGACAAATKPGGAVSPVRGLDISAYQHVGETIQWRLLAREGIRFVAIKVSEGTYYANPYYRSDARAAAMAGLQVLPYVFANPARARGMATARYAVRAAGGERGRLPFVVDLENDPYKNSDDCYGLGARAMIAWIAGFIGEAKALTGHLPVIYTTAAWWRECTGNTARFRRDTLWLAAFSGTPPATPSPWQHWTFWQYNSNGTLPGIGEVDLDYYQPTRALPALSAPAKRAGEKRPPKKKTRPPEHKNQPSGKKPDRQPKPKLKPKD